MSVAGPPKPVVFGCAGPVLGDDERRLFERHDPLGLIVFSRNVDTPERLAALVRAFRETVGRADAPVLIDQEGGRVARLGPPHWRRPPPARRFGEAARTDPRAAAEAAARNGRRIAADLAPLGIDVNCAPVLDLPAPGAHAVIGDRAYGGGAAETAALGRAACGGLLAGGVLPVLKHIPGHGRAGADSHATLPVVDAAREALEAHDFEPFRSLRDMPMAMTAHVVYTAIDAARPATVSRRVIGEAIRRSIGYGGLLISDDIGMAALSGTADERATAALDAGCDVVLHCSGDAAEMGAVAAALGPMPDAACERFARAAARRGPPRPFDDRAAAFTAADA